MQQLSLEHLIPARDSRPFDGERHSCVDGHGASLLVVTPDRALSGLTGPRRGLPRPRLTVWCAPCFDEMRFWGQATDTESSSYSICFRTSRLERLRRRWWKILMYSKMALGLLRESSSGGRRTARPALATRTSRSGRSRSSRPLMTLTAAGCCRGRARSRKPTHRRCTSGRKHYESGSQMNSSPVGSTPLPMR